MSSLVRRLSIRMMQRAGYTREKFVGLTDPITGERRIQEVRRGGEITDPDDNPIGRHWPRLIPARANSPRKAARANRYHVTPRALRRSKKSQAWLEARTTARKSRP
jgi:hypothetical protein